MIDPRTEIWTKRGWKKYYDLMYGDTVISYNPALDACEYDSIINIESTFWHGGLMNISKFTMDQLITPDHELLIWHSKKRTMTRQSINDVFMKVFKEYKSILGPRSLYYYDRTTDQEEIKWSARVCAIYAQNKYFRGDRLALEICDNLNGYEAQMWLDTFYHWNVLQPDPAWMKTCFMANHEIRDKMFLLAPKAGYGIKFRAHKMLHFKKGNMWIMSIAPKTEIFTYKKQNWGIYDGNQIVFNIGTKNGSFLARRKYGTFIMACKEQEK